MGSPVFTELKRLLAIHGIEPDGVVHVGAHKGEEVGQYARCGLKRMLLIEPNREVLPALYDAADRCAANRHTPGCDIHVEPVAVHSGDGRDRWIYRGSRTQLSSLLASTDPRRLNDRSIVAAKPLSSLDTGGCNVLAIDTQGTELDVLKSGDMSQYDMVICELDSSNRYVGARKPNEVCKYLEYCGLYLAHEFQHGHNDDVCDAVFVRQ